MRKSGYALHLLITAAVGMAYFALVETLFEYVIGDFFPPLTIALCIGVFAIAMYFVMYLLCKARKDYSGWQKKNLLSIVEKSYKQALIAIGVLFVLTFGFEFLYEIQNISSGDTSSYVFLIDDSGSMGGPEGSDPENKRVEAIKSIMSEDKDIPYAVYSFTDDAVLVREMGTYVEDEEYAFSSYGGTEIIRSLNTVLDDIEDDKFDLGKSPKILILSDGASSDVGLKKAIDRCRDNKIVVGSIGFKYDSDLLEEISKGTGGVYIKVDDVEDLEKQMKTAVTTTLDHNLFSERYVYDGAWIYAVMRIVFLTLLGVVWSWIKQKTYCSAYDHSFADKVFWISVGLCAFAAIFVEAMFAFVPDAADFAWAIRGVFFVLWAITPGFFVSGTENMNLNQNPYGVNGPSVFSNQDKRF